MMKTQEMNVKQTAIRTMKIGVITSVSLTLPSKRIGWSPMLLWAIGCETETPLSILVYGNI